MFSKTSSGELGPVCDWENECVFPAFCKLYKSQKPVFDNILFSLEIDKHSQQNKTGRFTAATYLNLHMCRITDGLPSLIISSFSWKNNELTSWRKVCQ